ncbi:MAG: hypothetical protein RUMPE_01113 [Eubacteriales bacterium SKADARSKE-1]|nr:hypothetical protein [Eubacteriales bacterium SKADARSKE-1]
MEKSIQRLLKEMNASNSVSKELEEYLANRFDTSQEIPKLIPDEPFISAWKHVVESSKEKGIEKALNTSVPHGETDIVLKSPESVSLEIYNSIAGNIPVIYAKDEDDFYELVTKIIHKGKEVPNIKKTGASFAYSKNNKFIILSNKPYSNIPAERLGLKEQEWRAFSVVIRREHECTHYFTKRFLGSSENNLHDELIADFAGILCATGEYHAEWFLVGMGIDKYPEEQKEGRFPVYTLNLSDEAKDILKKIIIKVAYNVETWSKSQEAKNMNRNEKVIFLCKNSLSDLYYMDV